MLAQTQLSLPQLESFVTRRKVMRCADLAGCGSGILMLATAAEIYRADPDLLKYVSFSGVDLDQTCGRMMGLNFLSHCLFTQVAVAEIVVWHGNGLASPGTWKPIIHATRPDLPPDALAPDPFPDSPSPPEPPSAEPDSDSSIDDQLELDF